MATEEAHAGEGQRDDEDGRLRRVVLQNAQSVLLARRRAEDALRKQSEWLRVTLASIGDAVISTDIEARVTFMNRVAESLTGWALPEAAGRPLSEVFRTVDGHTRQAVESPALRALRAGAVVGMSDSMLLVARDGSELPIDDRAAPIRDEHEQLVGSVLIFRDVTQRRHAEQALRRSDDNLREFFDNASIGLHWVGPDGTILRVNQTELELLGYAREEYVGRHIADFHVSRPVIDDILARLSRGETLRGYPAQMRCKDGSIKDVQINSNVLFEDGRFIHTRCFTLDVTDRKRAEAEREALLEGERVAREEAERASRLKEDFLATLSHEIRTPLNAILGWAQLLLKTPGLDPTLGQGLTVIERNARIQAQLIADLLDMSRIISGKMRLDVQRVELPLVIETAIESILPAAQAKGIRIERVLEPMTQPVHGDPARLQQVVWNLLSNAVKFTPRNGRVQVVLARVNSHVEISVSDTGLGIKSPFLPHVFERFRQADSSAARSYGGLGLGLAIVKQLVELHGGSVRVASEGEGQGATFTVQLPLAVLHASSAEGRREHPRAVVLQPSPVAATSLAGIRVLVVDDELDARDLVKRVLEQNEAEVMVASSAEHALSIVERVPLDVILSDIGMPDVDGYMLMRRIRNLGIKVPAAALTAFARSEDRTRALQAGYQTHISKPVDTAELLATVGSLAQMNTPKPDDV
jgi:PAS domain S-box-containing protein